ncbi:MAG: SDR family oxidoreductase [Chloroflexi bacterium]|nr:SDR family oxidoreductase [Chloroflexota bacterium]
MLNGRVAIVTGASEGIGRATAVALGQQGVCVILTGRRLANLKCVSEEIEQSGGQALPIAADVTDSKQVRVVAERAVESYGRIDLLINNVGGGLRKPLVDTTDEEWARLVADNLTATVYCCRAVIPIMRGRASGVIINVASRAGRIGEAEFAAYCAVKHGVVGLTKALAAEEAQNGIRLSAICPGPVSTERMRQALPQVDQSHWLRPEDVAQAILFLASSPSRTMQGKTLDLF